MTEKRSRRWGIALLVVGSVAFGVFLAGGLDLIPAGWGAPDGDPQAVIVHGGGLPGFADLAEAVAPAVVTIRAVSFQEAPEGHGNAADDDAGGAASGTGSGSGSGGGSTGQEND